MSIFIFKNTYRIRCEKNQSTTKENDWNVINGIRILREKTIIMILFFLTFINVLYLMDNTRTRVFHQCWCVIICNKSTAFYWD